MSSSLTLEDFKEITSRQGVYKGQKGVCKDCRNNNFKLSQGSNGSIDVYYIGLFDDNLKDKDLTKADIIGQCELKYSKGSIKLSLKRNGIPVKKGLRYSGPGLTQEGDVEFDVWHLKDGNLVDSGHWDLNIVEEILNKGEEK